MKRIGQVRFSSIEKRSRWLRIFRVRSARWMECVKDSWPDGPFINEPKGIERQAATHRALKFRAKELYRDRYGNPLLWFFLLEIVIKAIIWWLQSRKEQTP